MTNDAYKVVESGKTETGAIYHLVNRGDSEPKEFLYGTVRGGLTWPNQGAPGYYVILGQTHDVFQSGIHKRKQLSFLAEFESPNLGEFFKRLSEDAALFLCQSFYAEQGDLWGGYKDALYKYCLSNQIAMHPTIDTAVFVENFGFGASLIKEWLKDGALIIRQPSILYSQLADGGLREFDFNDADIAVRYYAVSALRHVVTAFHYYSLGPIKPIRAGRRRDALVI